MSNPDLDYLYSTAQVATTLDIGRSTVNKYVRSLEEEGYDFLRDSNNNRTYREHDIIVLRALVELLSRGVEYRRAINSIVERYKPLVRSESVDLVATSGSSHDLASISAKIEALTLIVGQLNEQINAVVDERVRSEVTAAAADLSGQVHGVLQEVRAAQERTEQQLSDLGSRIDQHGKRKKFLGLF